MHEAPGVMSVCQKVSSAPPRIWAPSCSISQQPALQSATQQPTTAAATAADNATALTTEHQEGRKLHSSQRGTRAQSAYRPADGSPSGVGEVIWSDTSCDPDSENSKHMRRQHNSNGTDTRRTRTYSLPQAADIGNSNGPVVPGLAAADAGAAGPLWVEVDVIANAGLTWIEVKNQVGLCDDCQNHSWEHIYHTVGMPPTGHTRSRLHTRRCYMIGMGTV